MKKFFTIMSYSPYVLCDRCLGPYRHRYGK